MERIKNYINGEWVTSDTEVYGDVYCPATGEKIAEVPFSTASDVDKAVKAAKEAFWDWRCTPPLTRARYFFKLKEMFEKAFEDISRILVREEGKTLDESRGEVRRMIENVEHATGVTTLMTGYNLEDIAHGIDCTAERQPIGVFGVIAPFNFPAMVPWWFLPYAVVCGNTYIVKPSELVPLTQTRIFEIIDECGFPEGVINMVHGSRDAVNAMLYHPDIAGISFVGQTSTARYIYKVCGETGKRVQSLGGAKNFIIVMPDAELDKAIPSLITSFYGCAGERCLSGSVLVAVGDVYDELKEKFVAAAKRLKVGNGLEEGVQMGPVISKNHKEKVLGYIEKGIKEGAELILDGRNIVVDGYPNGFFIGPTIFDNVTPEMSIAKEEIFGPVVSIIRVKNLDEALKLIQQSEYGNAACLYTTNGKTAREFKYRATASMLGINLGIAAPMSFFPFGGTKSSFFGDIKGQGREAFQFFTDTKVVIQRWT
ncbi:MAG TPA: CoA-acylating methylmalonate-semialdehyde dehydrogenase [Syntrophorhabdaceae bacterium]|nr:CoA-acylating methylmalonate-semialdehyde dehydrogenase [Syntrophorhabdaceae bacterium]